MICALGLEEQLCGISHECDYPRSVRSRPVVVRPALPVDKMSLAEIDRAVSERLRAGLSLYQVDEPLLRELHPTVLVTQDLCQVCALSGNEVTQVVKTLEPKPEVVWLTPHSLADVDENLREVARVTGRTAEAESLLATARQRIERVREAVQTEPKRPRVFCLEWVDPLYCSGHWVGEMVECAGGTDELSRRGTDSVRIPWEDVVRWAPEVLVVMPCGFHLGRAIEQTKRLTQHPGWTDLPAVRAGRVFAVDANAYFARPGPRLVDGIELLAHLFHPDRVAWNGPVTAFAQVKV